MMYRKKVYKHPDFKFLYIIVSLILIIILLVFTLLNTNASNLPMAGKGNLPNTFSYLDPTGKSVATGYFSVFDDKSGALAVVRILELHDSNNQVYGYIAANNNPQLIQKIFFSNSGTSLLFTTQKTKELFPLSINTKRSLLKTKADILNNLKKLGETPIILTLNFNTKSDYAGNEDSKYLECNSKFVKKLENGINNISLQCPLLTEQVSVYQQ